MTSPIHTHAHNTFVKNNNNTTINSLLSANRDDGDGDVGAVFQSQLSLFQNETRRCRRRQRRRPSQRFCRAHTAQTHTRTHSKAPIHNDNQQQQQEQQLLSNCSSTHLISPATRLPTTLRILSFSLPRSLLLPLTLSVSL